MTITEMLKKILAYRQAPQDGNATVDQINVTADELQPFIDTLNAAADFYSSMATSIANPPAAIPVTWPQRLALAFSLQAFVSDAEQPALQPLIDAISGGGGGQTNPGSINNPPPPPPNP